MTVAVAKHQIGPGHPCFVIAEAGVNHNGRLDLAYRLIDAAVTAGADAVKFQTFRAEALATSDAPKAKYQCHRTESTESQFAMLKGLELSMEMHHHIQAYCATKNIIFLSTPFDEASVDLLDALAVSLFKVPSGELTNLRLLQYIARKQRPMIVSTGMATLEEVGNALEAIRAAGNPPVIVLQCVSNYPADPIDTNLRAMATMANAFHVPVGYSDHTPGMETALAAVALGACVVEKHCTVDRALPGPDHAISLTPVELAAYVQAIRTVEAALGDGVKRPRPAEAEIARVVRKSLVAAIDIPAGQPLRDEWVVAKRPGTGLAPTLLGQLVGRRTRQPIGAGTLLAGEMFE